VGTALATGRISDAIQGRWVMADELAEELSAYQQVIDDLIHVHARVARDVVEIAPSTWAIHGPIAVDGEVIMAAFDSRAAANVAIDQLWSAEHGTTDL
jgi:hypothetical protein